MRSIRLLLFLFIWLHSATAYSQWQTINSGTTQNLVKGCFINDSTGFILSSGGLVLKTTNLGTTWIQCASLQGEFTSIFSIGSDTLYAGGNRLYRSADKGITWSLVTVFNKTITDLGFFDSKHGLALFPEYDTCRFGEYPPVVFDYFSVYKTSDYGLNWEFAFGNKDRTSRFQFPDHDLAYITGYVCGNQYHCVPIYWIDGSVKTSNAGNSWNSFNQPPGGMFLFSFINPDTGFFVKAVAPDSLYMTADGGASLQRTYTEINNPALRQCKFLSMIDGYLLFDYEIQVSGSGGFCWKTDYGSPGAELNYLFRSPSDFLFSVGENGLILKKHYIPSTHPDTVYRAKSEAASLSFGYRNVNSVSVKSTNITNTGSMASDFDLYTAGNYLLSIDSIHFDTSLVINLVPFQPKKIYVKFQPPSAQVFTDSLDLKTANRVVLKVPLNGTGVNGISGIISRDTLLCADTVRITGNLSVQQNATLRVCPGTFIQLMGNYSITIDGILKAVGDSLHKITFGTQDPDQVFHGLTFNHAGYNDTSVMRNCVIRQDNINQLIIQQGYVVIDHCILSNTSYAAVYFSGYASKGASITNSEIFNTRYGLTVTECDSLILANNNIHDNSRAVYCYHAKGALICGNSINHNLYEGIFLFNNHKVEACGNSIFSNGGGIHFMTNELSYMDAEMRIENNEIFNNTYFSPGGGFDFEVGGIAGEVISSPTYIVQNLIYNNTVLTSPGAGINLIGFGDGLPEVNLVSNTICNNRSGTTGRPDEFYATSYDWGFKMNILNNIFYNISTADSLVGWNSHVFPSMDFNCIGQSGVPGNNITEDPSFVSPTTQAGPYPMPGAPDWSLKSNSPCIDQGDTTHKELQLPLDFAGKPRFYNERIDIGAYEYQHPHAIDDHGPSPGISVFPNPAGLFLYVKTALNTPVEFTLIDQQGKVILAKTFIRSLTINTGNIKEGEYIYRIKSNAGIIQTGKLIIR